MNTKDRATHLYMILTENAACAILENKEDTGKQEGIDILTKVLDEARNEAFEECIKLMEEVMPHSVCYDEKLEQDVYESACADAVEEIRKLKKDV